jgi:hypothetical protein
MISLQIFVMNIVKTSIMPVIVKIAPPPIVNEERCSFQCAVRRQFWEDKKVAANSNGMF